MIPGRHIGLTALLALATVCAAPAQDSVTVQVFAGYRLTGIRISATDGKGFMAAGRTGPWQADTLRAGTGALVSSAMLQTQAGRYTASAVSADGLLQVHAQCDGPVYSSLRVVRGRLTVTARDDGLLQVLARESVRDYLASVLGTEAHSADPLQYLTALAVLQRNYLRSHPGRHAPDFDICDNTHCQRSDYQGVTPRVYAAVDTAAHIALRQAGALPCYYSANCGGGTLLPEQVWGKPEPGYSAVRCIYCRWSPAYRWTRTTPVNQVSRGILGQAPATPCTDENFKIRLGRALGFAIARSNTFRAIQRRGNTYLISGVGFGHRMGLCQDGALELARRGHTAFQILRFYFPQCTVSLQ